MKVGIENFEEKLKNLQSRMDKINNLSSTITDALSVKHQEIIKLGKKLIFKINLKIT